MMLEKAVTQVVNPFKRLRLEAKLNKGQLSSFSKIDVKALARAEDGMYTNPLPSLVDYWVRKGKISEGVLVTEYEDFVYEHRTSTKRKLGPNLNFDLTSNVHPLRQLRLAQGLELTAFCKALCLPLDTIQFFEKKWRTQKSVPKGLIIALNQNGYRQDEILAFRFAYADWRTSKLQEAYSFHD